LFSVAIPHGGSYTKVRNDNPNPVLNRKAERKPTRVFPQAVLGELDNRSDPSTRRIRPPTAGEMNLSGVEKD
jgi:hypothetical protein